MTKDTRASRAGMVMVAVMGLLASACDRPAAPPSSAAVSPQTPLHSALSQSPAVSAARQQLLAARRGADLARTARAHQLTGVVNAGGTARSDGKSEMALQGTLSFAKLLVDGGQAAAAISTADLVAQREQLAFQLVANRWLSTVLRLRQTERAAAQTIALTDKYLEAYRSRSAMLQIASQGGMISNSEMIEIRSLKNRLDQQRLEARLARDSASISLRSALGAQYAQALPQVDRALARIGRLPADAGPHYQMAAAQVDVALAEQQRQQEQVANRPSAHFQAQLSAPANGRRDAQLSLGVAVSFTLDDAGRGQLRTQAATHGREAALAAQEQLALELKGDLDLLRTAEVSLGQSRALIHQQRRLSQEHLEQMETLLRMGQADIISVVKEALAGAEAELALIRQEDAARERRISWLALRGSSCAAFDVCTYLEKLGEAP